MRIIITGGTGLIGRNLSTSLASDGHEVIVLSRSPERANQLPAGTRTEHWDARTTEGWGHLVNEADAIVNLAGESIGSGRWTESRKRRILDSRLDAGHAVLQAVQQADRKPDVVIQASGVGYYGPRQEAEISEEANAGQDWLAQVAVRWEESTAAVKEMGVRRAVIRIGVVLSLENGAFPRMLLPFRLFVGGRLGGGRQWFPWIHMKDQVDAIRFLIENTEAHGPYNLSAPEPVTNAQFSTALGQVMGRPSVVPTPGFALKMLFGEMATLLLDGQRAVPKRLLDLGFEFRFPTLETALQDLVR